MNYITELQKNGRRATGENLLHLNVIKGDSVVGSVKIPRWIALSGGYSESESGLDHLIGIDYYSFDNISPLFNMQRTFAALSGDFGCFQVMDRCALYGKVERLYRNGSPIVLNNGRRVNAYISRRLKNIKLKKSKKSKNNEWREIAIKMMCRFTFNIHSINAKIALKKLLKLNERDIAIYNKKIGGATFAATGREFGLSGNRVRQIFKKVHGLFYRVEGSFRSGAILFYTKGEQ